jgi:hypothetical protein
LGEAFYWVATFGSFVDNLWGGGSFAGGDYFGELLLLLLKKVR